MEAGYRYPNRSLAHLHQYSLGPKWLRSYLAPMVDVFAKVIVAGVELLALALLGVMFLILPDAANPFLWLITAPTAFLFVYTLFDALLR